MNQTQWNKLFYYAHLPLLITVGISALFFFSFTAEDAYITYRYAENLIDIGALVYNVGEPINAMTSPLHAIFSAALYGITGQTVLSNKIVAFLLLIASAALVWRRFRKHPPLQLLALVLVLMPPSVLLWTFGGLETPLLLFLVTVAVYIASRRAALTPGRLFALFFLASLAFLTRYDSVLFFAPLLVYVALKARSVSQLAIAVVGAAILPVAWLAISFFYYGDLLPTSFYVKTPVGNVGHLIFNGIYMSSYLLFIGLIPVSVLAIGLLNSKRQVGGLLWSHVRAMWWLYLGLLLELLYGLTMATHHMMFSFRFFVPYIPAAALLVVDFMEQATEENELSLSSGGTVAVLAGFVLLLASFQLYQTVYTYNRSVNGIAFVGEYQSLGVRDYVQFMQTLEKEALDIEAHWSTVNGDENRPPRVITYAGGMLPYTFRNAYIYEKLVSFRHCYQRHKQAQYADYIHILVPRHGELTKQLPGPDDGYAMVSSYTLFFDGAPQEFLVYYNPQPQDHNLSATISGACPQANEGIAHSESD